MAKRYPRLAPEDEATFLRALLAIWNIEGYDWLTATAEEKGIRTKTTHEGYHLAPAEQVTMSRAQVMDIATDRFAGGGNTEQLRHFMSKEQYERIREWMFKTPGHIVDQVARKAFPEKRFGA